MKEIKININDNVRFKLTEFGYMVFQKDYNKYLPAQSVTYFKDMADKDGYITMQLHTVMNTFGEHMLNGGRQVIVDNTILYEPLP